MIKYIMFVSAVRLQNAITLKTIFQSSKSFDACSNAIQHHIMTIFVAKIKYYYNMQISQNSQKYPCSQTGSHIFVVELLCVAFLLCTSN